MINLMLSELLAVTAGELVGQDTSIDHISTDSRDIRENTLFVALKGEIHDGHDFVKTAVDNGAKAILVERNVIDTIPQLIVSNSLKAMGYIGGLIRDKVDPICVALTGSNGKTTVKEMLATILSQKHQVLYTAGNFNNEVGVPLTLFRLTEHDEYGVFELGANHASEIDYTSSLVKPSVALVNNIASAHLEGFGSIEGVAYAKAEIFNHLQANGTAIINADDNYAVFMQLAAEPFKQLSFGVKQEADVRAINLNVCTMGYYSFDLFYQDKSVRVRLPLAGYHQVSNALAATSICLALGFNLAEIANGLAYVKPVKGRMQPHQLGRVTVIDDSYNANPASVTAAISWLKKLDNEKVLVLGDLGELGEATLQLHADVGYQAREQGIDALFCNGVLTKESSQAFGCTHYQNQTDLIKELIEYIKQLPNEVTVLVKGSRSAKMEKVVEALTVAFGRGEFV